MVQDVFSIPVQVPTQLLVNLHTGVNAVLAAEDVNMATNNNKWKEIKLTANISKQHREIIATTAK